MKVNSLTIYGMKTNRKNVGWIALLVFTVGVLQSCKNDDPSIIKIFVRSASNQLVEGARVVIIGDVNSNPATKPYVDTVFTNGSGFAHFNMDPHYEGAGKDYTVGYFDVLVKYDTILADGYIRSRVNTTAVETIFLPPN